VVYHYRIFDRYRRDLASLAVLADGRPSWRPDRYEAELWGCRRLLMWPVAKLLDLGADWERLERDPNPFAVLIMAHLKTQATRRDPDARYHWKLHLVRALYQRGYPRRDVVRLFKVMDWLMALPRELEDSRWQEVESFEQKQKMPYITAVERIGMKRGLHEGLLRALRATLRRRLQTVPESLEARLTGIADPDTLDWLNVQAGESPDLEAFTRLVEEMSSSQPA